MTALLIILVVLIFVTWLYSMYATWKIASGADNPVVATDPFLKTWEQSSRLTRRGWYSALVHLKHGIAWSGTKAQRIFVKVFPKSATLFEKKDHLVGLTHGPSSYFLKSISFPKKPVTKRLPRIKKTSIVATPNDQTPGQAPE